MRFVSGQRWARFVLVAAACAGPLLPGLACTETKPLCAKVRIKDKTWYVDLAVTDAQRYKGLSGRSPLGPDLGMLFLYPREKVLTFCMRDCDYPLDIVFLDSRRRVVQTCTMAVEPDRSGTAAYSSVVPAQYALEIQAGEIEARNIRPGDEATFLDLPEGTKADDGL